MRFLIEPRYVLAPMVNFFLSYSLPLRIDEMEFHFLFLSLLAIVSLLYVVVTKSFILLASAAKRTLYYLGSKMMFKDQILNSFEYRILIRSEMRFIDEILISYECRVLIILPSCSMMLSFSFVNGCSGVLCKFRWRAIKQGLKELKDL
ncbi:hypothetical protein Tco_0322654 [Tanacetum coccineum]